jgi:hypothetical protein
MIARGLRQVEDKEAPWQSCASASFSKDFRPMNEIVNLRRARKAKARAEAQEVAAANRARFGTPEATRALTKAQSEKAAQILDSHRIERDKDLKD